VQGEHKVAQYDIRIIEKKNIEPAGASSGFVHRFEVEKNNPKIIKERNHANMSVERPYTTQKGMRAHRLDQERQSAVVKMVQWEELHPYYIDPKPILEQKPKSKRIRPQTVKERRSQNVKYYRDKSGLNQDNDEINKLRNCDYIPVECRRFT
jgi:hypothetical protein